MEILTRIPRVRSTEPSARATLDIGNQPTVEVIDVAGETQAKLVEMDREAMEAINAPESPLRAVPVVEYDRPDPRPRPQLAAANMPAAVSRPVTFTCRDARSGAALAGVQVVAFTNFSSRAGGSGFTDAAGRVVLHLAGAVVERLFCYAPFTHWGAFRKNVSTATAIQVTHEPVDLSYTDCVRHYYGGSRFNPNLGVTVGVIDTGSGPHADLNIVGGRNTVTGEPATDFADGDIHGTHVAGLIGSRGTPPTGLRGLAPGVRLWIGRVFGANAEGASNYSILKAMIFAAAEGCDIINLSLGGGPFDPIVEEAIADARNQGMLVVVAAGNDGRRPVNFPAAYRGATAVSAMGREGTFPAGSVEEGDVSRPPSGNDAREFLAEFSNIGNEISVTGLGVGTLSTLPNNQHGPLSGTSMAAPVVAGAAACLLSRDPVVHAMARNRTRSDQIERLLLTSCVKRGFGQRFEGFGLPDPALI
jgi:subtilisin